MIFDLLTTPQTHQFDPRVNILLVSVLRIFSQAYGDITSGSTLCTKTKSIFPETNILTGKRKATKQFCQVRHVVYKHKLHKLTMTRNLSKASGLFEFIDFCLSGMLANIQEYFSCCH